MKSEKSEKDSDMPLRQVKPLKAHNCGVHEKKIISSENFSEKIKEEV